MTYTETLTVTTPTDREIAMTRVFDAPRSLVFEALTTPEILKRWFYGPPIWSLAVCEMDLKAGGAYRWEWHGPNGMKMGVSGVFQEVAPPGYQDSSQTSVCTTRSGGATSWKTPLTPIFIPFGPCHSQR